MGAAVSCVWFQFVATNKRKRVMKEREREREGVCRVIICTVLKEDYEKFYIQVKEVDL